MGMAEYGSAAFKTHYKDGTVEVDHVEVVSADPVIGISLELLGQGEFWCDDEDGAILLAGDPAYQYRPVGFAHHDGHRYGVARVLICKRVEKGT